MRAVKHLGLLAFLAACAGEPPTAATRPLPKDPSAVLLPASAYRRVKVPFPGQRSGLLDVNDRLQMVGYLEDDAILMELHGGFYVLDRLGGHRAEARAVNIGGAAAGWVMIGNRQTPAIWKSPIAPPDTVSEMGWVWDMNDRREAVGTVYRLSYTPFYWESRTGTLTTLPLPRGASWAQATGINNDRIIVGLSSVGGVMWRQRLGGWSVTVLSGIDPWAIDAGYGTVGSFANQPVWGKPSVAGSFGVSGIANGIHPDGTVSGGVSNVLYGSLTAFVADRSGGMTLLPHAPGATDAQADNSARCGLVVGRSFNTTIWAYEAVYWDPGC